MPKYIKPILVRGAALLLSLTLSVSLLPVTVVASTGADQPDTCSPNTAEMINDTLAFLAGGQAENNLEERNDLAGKTLSILGASISTYEGTSNGAAADTTNSTIRSNAKYYPSTTVTDVTLNDTWWMQVVNDLGLRLLVNNSWSGSSLLHERSGTVGAYVDRCVQLHDDTGDNAGEEPDIIGIQMGTNDFQYYKDTLGTADIDYAALITDNGDGTYAYAQPVTSLEAAAIVLHKISVRYPDAEVYYLNISQRVDGTDALIQSFNAELAAVCGHFGAHVVDIYGSAITMEEFDTYIGDGRVHPNKLGMDAYTEAFKAAVLANTAYSAETYTVSFDLTDASADYGTDKAVVSGDSFYVNLTADAGNCLDVTVTMGGEDITDRTYADGTVTIDAVTANVTITAKGVHEPQNYRWELTETGLTGESNALTLLEGTVTEGQFSKVRYKLSESIVLRHDLPWVMEWKSTGDMQNTSGNGARLFNNAELNNTEGAPYIFKSSQNYIIAMGERKNSTGQNYGIALADYGIDGSETHTYRLENRIAGDGSNMVYLYVDGAEIGPMNHHYQALNDTGTTSDWINGRDFTFTYMGTASHALTNCSIDYIQVWEGGLTHAIPENQGVTNAIERAYQLTDVTWTPIENVPGVQNKDGSYIYSEFEAGVTYKGIPYSGVIATDTYVGLNVSLESFLSALKNENSVLYTKNLYSDSYPKASAYFGTVCSKFAQYVLDIPGSYNTNNVANIPGMDTIALPGEYTVDQIRLGDVILDVVNHTAVCTDILYDSDGNVAYIEVSEAVMPLVRRILWSPEEFYDHFADYRLCRYQFIDDVPAPEPVDISDTDYALMPRCGNKYNYRVSDAKSVVDILKPGYAKAVILRDGVIIDEIDIDDSTKSILFDRSVPGLLEFYLEKADGTQSESVYVCVVKSSVAVTDSSEFTSGKLTVTFDGSSGTPLYVQVGSAHAIFCNVEGQQGMAELTFAFSKVSTKQVRVAYQNEYGIYLSSWSDFTTAPNSSEDPLLAQGEYWDGYNLTPSSPTPVVQENKVGYWTYTMIPVEENTTYYSEGATRMWFVDNNGDALSTYNAYKDSDVPFQFTTPVGTAYVSIAYSPDLVEQGTETLLEVQPMSLFYDDHLDLTGKTVEIIDAGAPTSYQVGYGVEENTVPDTAVVTLDGSTLVATGIGTATVRIDGTLYEITVTAAPISLLLLAGQSNMQGSEGDANQSIVCPDGMVYATYGDRYNMTIDNAANYAASALTGEYSSINVNGTTDQLSGYPLYSLSEAGAGKAGPDSGFAYEWVQQTDEKVWVVNAAHGGSAISTWQDGGANFEEAVALFSACQETLRQEIAAGHYTLSHMGYFWCQGCADETKSAQWYVDQYLTMHESLKTELSFDADSDPTTPDITLEFAGLIPIRSGHQGADSYRAGTYTDTTTAPYFESFKDLRFNGPRVAQYWMGNNPELTDIWNVCTIGEDWVWMPDGTNGVSDYFRAHYENGTVDYTPQVKQSSSWYTPTTPAAVHDSIHYNQIGYNEVGRESVRNALIYLNEVDAPETEISVEFVSWDGFSPVTSVTASTVGSSTTLAVPMVSPVYRSKDVAYQVSEGLTYEYYDLLADSVTGSGTLTASDAEGSTVTVSPREPVSYRWDCDGTALVSVTDGGSTANALTKVAGTITDGVFTDVRYRMTEPVVLCHDSPWVVEWKMTGNWSGMLLSASGTNSTEGNAYLFKSISTTPLLAFGERANGQYYNYGVVLDTDLTLPHIYRLENRVTDGGNMVYLLLDGVEIGPMTNYYIGSSNQNQTVNWVSGQDFVFSYIGASGHPVTNGSLHYLAVVEDAGESDIHFHDWSDWTTVSLPTVEACGQVQRTCSTCGEVEQQSVDGVWQKWNLSDHLSALPENLCCDTNLWTALEHDEEYFANGIDWGVHSSGQVYSVTIPVSAGDRIYASSFGAAGTNGSSSNGIRVTFFDAYGIAKTMAPAETFAECSANGYLTAPEGVIAVNVPMWTNSDAWKLYIRNREHSYQNGICTGCGAKTALSDADDYAGKVISILGDSISTFAGYIPTADGFNLEHLARYPQDNLLTDVNETWWMQVITQLDAKLGINDSWRGATVSGAAPVTTGTTGENAAMSNLIRIQNLGSNGTPDVILFYGGTNDLAHVSKVGTFDPETAPAQVDLTTTKWDNLADGYVHTLLRLQHYYPDAVILAMLPTVTTSYYSNEKLAQANEVLTAICEHYGVPCVDLRYCGITTAELPDGIHPDATGMDYITDAVLNTLLAECEITAGENVVYSVTHNLTNAAASLGHYKGVSAGTSFEETLSGENLSVTVTMGSADVTSVCYQNGRVTIADVKGNIVISAKAVFSLGERLQQIPEDTCAGINLWNVLEPENEYYTGTGWGNVAGGGVYSVTIPVTSGQRLWATSFGASGTNGGSRNGIRLTWFDENGVLKSVAPDKVYSEFAASGYVAVPAGATAANVVMWNGSESNELYVLTLPHSFEDWELVTAPTYTQTGLEQRVCAYGCGTVETQMIPATGPALVEAVDIVYDDQTNTVHLANVPEGLTVVLAIYENGQMVYADLHSDTGENTSFDLPSKWDGATASVFFLTSEWQSIGQSRTIF